MASLSLERAIISAVRKRPMTVPKIAEAIGKHQHTVRAAVEDLRKRNVLLKGPTISGYNTVVVGKYLQRERPLLRVWSSAVEGLVYAGLETFLSFAGQRTKASEAVDAFPLIVSKLLMIGFKYNTIKDQWILEAGDANDLKTRLQPLRRELRSLRVDFDGYYHAIHTLNDLFVQLKEGEEFWDLEQLGNHYNKQIAYDTQLIPPIDSHEVVETVSTFGG